MIKLLWILIPVLIGAVVTWGSWATMTMTTNTPRQVFDEHVQKEQDARDKIQEKIDMNQRRVEDKLDKIQEYLMEKL